MGKLIPGRTAADVFFDHPDIPTGIGAALEDGFGVMALDVRWDMTTALDATPDGEYTLELLFQSGDDAHAFYQECYEYAEASGDTTFQSAEWSHPVRNEGSLRPVRGAPTVTCVFRGEVYISGAYERLPMVAGVPDFMAHLVGLAEQDALTDEFDAGLPARYDDESEPTGPDVFRAQQADDGEQADDGTRSAGDQTGGPGDDADARVSDDYGTPVLVEASDADASTEPSETGATGMPECPECEAQDVIQLSTGEWVCQQCTHVFEPPGE